VISGEDKTISHAEMEYNGQKIMFGKQTACEKKPPMLAKDAECPISLYVYCEDVDSFYKAAVAAGANSLAAPEDTFWGDRMCRLQDPEGYQWSFATPQGSKA
jgi:uncharacterized glyoxalase superfamily protein PhnB